VAVDGSARVFSAPAPRGAGKGALQGGQRRIYGCLFKRGAAVALITGKSELTRVGRVVLRGATVAFERDFMGVDFSDSSVSTLELATGHRTTFPSWTFGEPGLPESFYSVTDLALDAAGSAAWITRRTGVSGPVGYEVLGAPRKGHAVLMDSGAGIDPRSLALGGGRLSWLNGGVRRSAALP